MLNTLEDDKPAEAYPGTINIVIFDPYCAVGHLVNAASKWRPPPRNPWLKP